MSALPELPKPAVELHGKHRNGSPSAESMRLYTAEQMREYGDARAAHARKQALEEAVAWMMRRNETHGYMRECVKLMKKELK